MEFLLPSFPAPPKYNLNFAKEPRRACSSRIEPIVEDDHFDWSRGKGEGEGVRWGALKHEIVVLQGRLRCQFPSRCWGSKGVRGGASSDTQLHLPRAHPHSSSSPRRIKSHPIQTKMNRHSTSPSHPRKGRVRTQRTVVRL